MKQHILSYKKFIRLYIFIAFNLSDITFNLSLIIYSQRIFLLILLVYPSKDYIKLFIIIIIIYIIYNFIIQFFIIKM
jgi:hypothetical protein